MECEVCQATTTYTINSRPLCLRSFPCSHIPLPDPPGSPASGSRRAGEGAAQARGLVLRSEGMA